MSIRRVGFKAAGTVKNMMCIDIAYGGDVLFFCSDGITEAGIGEPFGTTRVKDVVVANKHKTAMARDIDDAPVFLSKSSWETSYVAERYPKVAFTKTRERM